MINSFRNEYAFLSNFYSCQVELEDDMNFYNSVEHAYQAAKTLDPEERRRIHDAPTSGKAKRLGGKVTLREDWDKIRLEVMEFLLRQKFSEPELKEQLLQTGTQLLVESNTWHDKYWGVCNGYGKNHLGKLLMKIRKELQENA